MQNRQPTIKKYSINSLLLFSLRRCSPHPNPSPTRGEGLWNAKKPFGFGLPLLPLWEKGVGGMRVKRREKAMNLEIIQRAIP